MILCSSFKNAHEEISEYLLHVANGWVRLETQLTHVGELEPLMEDYHRAVYQNTLSTLQVKIQTVCAILRSIMEPVPGEGGNDHAGDFRPKRLKHAFKKGGLERAIEELKTWINATDLTWFLTLRMLNSQVDIALAQHGQIFTDATPSILPIRANLRGNIPDYAPGTSLGLPLEYLEQMCVTKIPFCNVLLATTQNSEDVTTTLILNRMNCPPLAQLNSIKKETRGLAQRLQHRDPGAFGLLNCQGFITRTTLDPSTSPPRSSVESTLLFDVPPGRSHPRSLRDILLSEPRPGSLTSRVALARELAKAVGFMHAFGFVHKNIRPESVLLFDKVASNGGDGHEVLGGSYLDAPLSAFLVGFEDFRREEGRTHRLGDETFDANLYRHPDRQGPSPETVYIMQHDIYSLGVCLLEVGLWRSLVEYDHLPGQAHTVAQGAISTRPSTLLDAPAYASSGRRLLRYVLVSGKDRLLDLARLELARVMGTEYSKVVETCLTCLDENNDDFGDQSEFEDADGIVVGARYIEKASPSSLPPSRIERG